MIGEIIRVSVLGVKGNHVRLGIDAPKGVQVHREEVYQRIRLEGQVRNEEPPPAEGG